MGANMIRFGAILYGIFIEFDLNLYGNHYFG